MQEHKILPARQVEPGVSACSVSPLRLVPWGRFKRCGDSRNHQLGGEGQWVSGDANLRMAGGTGEGGGVRVSGGDQAEPCLESGQNLHAEGSSPDPAGVL